jgi:hypothetical protein
MDEDFLNHFVPRDQIPEVPDVVSLIDLYETLAVSGARGFIATRDGRPSYYVDSVELGNNALQAQFPFTKSIGEALKRLSPTLIPIEEKAVVSEEDWKSLRTRVSGLVSTVEMPGSYGWFLNHEFVFATSVGKPQFICANGHANASPDHGRCSVCPAKLLTVQAATSQALATESAE